MTDSWLTGWKCIANYCGVSVTTVKRYYKIHAMPIQKLPTGKPQAKKEDLDSWVLEISFKVDEFDRI